VCLCGSATLLCVLMECCKAQRKDGERQDVGLSPWAAARRSAAGEKRGAPACVVSMDGT
jgi:hypothetical protein